MLTCATGDVIFRLEMAATVETRSIARFKYPQPREAWSAKASGLDPIKVCARVIYAPFDR
jgi:hypothetical protein